MSLPALTLRLSNARGVPAGRRVLVVVAILAVVTAGIAQRPIRAMLAARQARRAIARLEFERAIPLLDHWRALDPSHSEIPLLEAQARYELGQYAPVSQLLDRATWLGCPERPVFRLRALLLVKQGRFIEAEPILLNLLNESSAPDPPLDEALTRVFLETYRLDHAVKIIQVWIRDAPRDPKPYLWWTEVDRRIAIDNPAAMEGHYRQALELDPNLAQARLGLAETLRFMHQSREAVEEYNRYLALRPDDVMGYVGLARTALDDGDLDAASRSIDRAIKVDADHPEVLKLRAVLEIRAGHDQAALSLLNQAVKSAPLDVDSLYNQLLALTRLGRKQEAEQVRRRVTQLREDQLAVVRIRDRLIADPNNNDIRCEMARWMLVHGREDESIRWLRSILDSRPGHPEATRILVEYHQKRGEIGLANYYRSRLESRPEADAVPR